MQSEQPAYSNIVPDNFSATADIDRESCHVLYETADGDQSRLMNVEIAQNGGAMPEEVPGTQQHYPGTSMAIAYDPLRPNAKASHRWVFYMRGQGSGVIDYVVYDGKNWSKPRPMMNDMQQEIRVGDQAKLAIVTVSPPWCELPNPDYRFRFLLYIVDKNGKLQQFTGPYTADGQEYWEQEVVRVDDKEVSTLGYANIAVCKGRTRSVMAYMDSKRKVRVAYRLGIQGTWKSDGEIPNARESTPLSVGVRSTFFGRYMPDSVFSIFYREKGSSETGRISEKRRFYTDAPQPDEMITFGTASAQSSLNCASLKGYLPLAGGEHVCLPALTRPDIRLFSCSNLDGKDTLFQFVRDNANWVIPEGLIITNAQGVSPKK